MVFFRSHPQRFLYNSRTLAALVILLGLCKLGCATTPSRSISAESGTPDIVALHDIDPTIQQDMRYASPHNFIGKVINGYKAPKCFLSRPAAQALAMVQAELRTYALSLKVYDCYRPQRAVDEFVAWSMDPQDHRMKQEFYPRVDKAVLFQKGYIAKKSGHSRGSTTDLTIVPVPTPSEATYVPGQPLRECYLDVHQRFRDNSLDMGTGYDCLDPLAHPANPDVGPLQKRNRLLLKTMMEKYGFQGIVTEWWHFTLKNEPYPQTYFDFEIE